MNGGTCPECGTPNPKHHWGTTYFCENPKCGAMLNRNDIMPTRSIYTALRFANAPDLHLTLRYYKDVDPGFEQELIQRLKSLCHLHDPRLHVINLPREDRFGPRRNIRVLIATDLPDFAEVVRNAMQPPKADTYPFNPHITSDWLQPCAMAVTGVAVMHKKDVIWEHDFL